MFIIRRVLIANRGEIAVRVIRTCQRLGIETVLAVAEADADSRPARLADRTIRIGPAGGGQSLTETYLSVEAVVGAAVAAGADAIHPGYGFLAENPRLARACEAAGIIFVGPGPEVLEAAGDKLAARAHAAAAGAGGCGWSATPGTSITPSRWPAPRRRRRSGIRGCTWSGTSPPHGMSRCSCWATGKT